MDEFVCPWCGCDLLPILTELKPCSFDTVYEAHAEECSAFQAEINGTTNQSLPCEGDS